MWRQVGRAVGRALGSASGEAPLGSVPAGGLPGWFVTPEEAAALGEAAVWLDTREAAVFALGHAPGAARAGWRDFTTGPRSGVLRPVEALEAQLGALGVEASRPVVVAGGWARGYGEEGHLAWLLRYLGHPQVAVLYGGAPRWGGAGLPVERGLGRAPQRRPFKAQPQPGQLATGAWLQAEKGEVLRLDVRSREEFEGVRDQVEGRGGHLPGAEHGDWQGCFEPSGALKPPEALRAFYLGTNQDIHREVMVYCSGGVRSGFVAWALGWAGVSDVRNYAGSWWAWARGEPG